MYTSIEQTIFLSLKIAFAAVLVNFPPGLFFGWLLARKSFRGKLVLDTAVNLPLVLPPVVTGYFLLLLFGREGIFGSWLYAATGLALSFTWQAAALAAAVVSFPLLVRSVRVAIENVDPRLEEAGRVLRAGPWRVFWRITFPMASNGVIAGLLLAFARSLGEFGATIMVAGNIPGKTQTMPLAIFSLVNQPNGEKQAAVLIIAAIVFAYASLIGSELLMRHWRTAAKDERHV